MNTVERRLVIIILTGFSYTVFTVGRFYYGDFPQSRLKAKFHKLMRFPMFPGCCYITVDFATAASQNVVCKTEQMCHIINLFRTNAL
jgi:hypothetical protein